MMPNQDKVHTIYFLGIGGIGMSALARYFKRSGKEIYGYDLTPTPLTSELVSEGMHISFDEDLSKIPSSIDLVIHTPAIPKSHPIYQYFDQHNIPIRKRAEILGSFSSEFFTIAVAGTHGKTSISAITAHLLKSAGRNVTAFVGGIMKNYKSNLIVSKPTDYMVVEADEFDHSFLWLHPGISLISSTDADHLDVYGTHDELKANFRQFANKSSSKRTLIINEKAVNKEEIEGKYFTYGVDKNSDFKALDIRIEEGHFVFDLEGENISLKSVRMNIPGHHYVENAVGASAIASQIGLDANEIKNGLESFKGVERRFEFKVKNPKCVYIDDYAHHPEEIKATVKAVRKLFPGKRITGVFQPHLFSRTRDFASDFAKALDKLDEVIILDIYPAREKQMEGINSGIILSEMKNADKKLLSKEELYQHLEKTKPSVLLTMGAGDIGLMTDKIERILEK